MYTHIDTCYDPLCIPAMVAYSILNKNPAYLASNAALLKDEVYIGANVLGSKASLYIAGCPLSSHAALRISLKPRRE